MELIKLTKNEQGIETVNARELHAFLEVKSKFADWFKNPFQILDSLKILILYQLLNF